MGNNSKGKKAAIIIPGILILLALLAVWLYSNRQYFVPTAEAVTYLQASFRKDTAQVQAGVRVQNRAPLPFTIDSVQYQILNNGVKLGWGQQVLAEHLPAFDHKVLDFGLTLDLDRYLQQLARQKHKDSLDLEVRLKVYLDPPLFRNQVISINRHFSTPVLKTPAVKLDTLLVKHFSPDSGYTFLLKLQTQNALLPGLKLKDLHYQIRFSDSLLIKGKADSTFHIAHHAKTVTVPIHLKTAEMVALLRLKVADQKTWPYHATVSTVIQSEHPLFAHTSLSLEKSGIIDTRSLGSSQVAMPSVKRLENIQLITTPKTSYLEAGLLINNPTILPLYLDSARYLVRYRSKVVASGGRDYEQIFPAQTSRPLKLQLAINNQHYQQMVAQGKGSVPLEAEVFLYYNLKGSKPQTIAVKKQITYPVVEDPTFKLTDIGIRKLGPKMGAQLFAKMEVNSKTPAQIDELKYRIVVDKKLEVTGQTHQVIQVDTGTSEIEIPVDLSAQDVNMISKGLISGQEIWDYTFEGSANVSVPNSLFQNTAVKLATSGVFNINSKGSPDYMPEISKIDTLFATIHYDSAWVRMYAAIYNTLPITINLSHLEVDVINEQELIGATKEKLFIGLLPDTNTFAWHTLGIDYGKWEAHVKNQKSQDSMLLKLPATLTFELGNLGKHQVTLNLDTRIPTPKTPVTLLKKVKIKGFSFRDGLKFDALVAVQNANSPGLTVKNIDYLIKLDNGVDLCGKINRSYEFPIGVSEVKVPINLSVWEGFKMLTRQLFGPPLIDYKLNATAQISTKNPKLSNVYVIFENYNRSNLKEKKTIKN